MNIGIDISQIVYQTGVSRYTEQLVKHLIKLNTQDKFYLFSGSLRQKQILSSFIKQLNSKRVGGVVTSLSPHLIDFFWNRLNIFSPDKHFPNLDVFHTSDWAIPSTQAKLVTTIHDLTFFRFPHSHTSYSRAVHKRHLKQVKKHADAIIAVSQATKKDLIKYGIDKSRIEVIYEAASSIFKPQTNLKKIRAVKEKYNLKNKYILSVGTQEPRKNLKRLIKAYQGVVSDKSNLNLIIVGKFGWGDEIEPSKNIKLLGFIPDEDLAVLYSAAKFFIYPSLYEGFGLPVLEAMACGCPVITSNTSSLPEVGGSAALYVNPKKTYDIFKTIQMLIKASPSKLKTLSQKSLDQAKQFSWHKTAKQTLEIYKNLC